MRIFVTSPSSYVGSAITAELLEHGHVVSGFAPSNGHPVLPGVELQEGSVRDVLALRRAASVADGVIHEAPLQVGPGTDFPTACGIETAAVAALGDGLAGSGKPYVVTSGVGLIAPASDGLAREQGGYDMASPAALRIPTELAAFAAEAVRCAVIRFAWCVHGDGSSDGFLPALVALARRTGVSAYIGDGANRWSAVHRRDLATAYRLALEVAPAGSRLHAVADEGVEFRLIAQAIASRLGVEVRSIAPGAAGPHFGWLTPFVQRDSAASSEVTRAAIGWEPRLPGLLADIASGDVPD